MAQDVQDALETLLKEEGCLKDRDVKNYIDTMKVGQIPVDRSNSL